MDHSYGTRLKDRVKEEEARARSQAKQKAANVKVVPRLRPIAYDVSDIDHSAPLELIAALEVNGEQFYFTGELVPLNRRGFKYKPCRAQPNFKANIYATTEVEPAQARFSYSDRAQAMQLNASATQCTVDEGWRLVRANVGIREGTYYFEFNIVRANRGQGHVRVGIARKEANLEAPVGFDGYSYGIRDVSGELMTLLRPQGQLVEEGFGDGDVIGFLVEFPSLQDHRQAVDQFIQSVGGKALLNKRRKKGPETSGFTEFGNIVRDQVPIKFKNELYFEQFEYTASDLMNHLLNPVTVFGEKAVIEQELQLRLLSNLPRIAGSKITIFKNGTAVGEPLENVYSFLPTSVENDQVGYNAVQAQNNNYRNTDDGTLGYYPMALCFKGGVVELNAGPDFQYPVEGARPLSERFDDQVISEWYWDLVDEVEAEYLDSFFE